MQTDLKIAPVGGFSTEKSGMSSGQEGLAPESSSLRVRESLVAAPLFGLDICVISEFLSR